ncbi:MAG: hypothetical protein II926_05305 [Bacteroidales bacterium]|nr:hypothetical protein [Bacteroidales bacterium]
MNLRKTTIKGEQYLISAKENKDDYFGGAYSLLKKMFVEMTQLAKAYHSTKFDFVDYPFAYRERQLDSLMLPALSKLCKGIVIAEYPVERQYKLDDDKRQDIYKSSGRVDYWCIYKGYSFVIEVKHAYDNPSNQSTTDALKQRWLYMNATQLQTIKKYLSSFGEATNGIIRLGLLFVSSYMKENKRENDLRTELKRISQDICTKKPTKTTPDFVAGWEINTKFMENKNGDGLFYPSFMLISKVFSPIKHNGGKNK